MKINLFLLTFLAACITQFSTAQKIPVIKASSDRVDIRDGDDFQKNAWGIDLSLNPDIYISNNSGKRVTFYTDMDSISFVVKENEQYDFVILLNEKDSAYTQIKYKPSHLDIL